MELEFGNKFRQVFNLKVTAEISGDFFQEPRRWVIFFYSTSLFLVVIVEVVDDANTVVKIVVAFTWDVFSLSSPVLVPMAKWLKCWAMVRETCVQSQVASYQRLYKWYLTPPYLTLSSIRYVSRVKRNNPGNGVAPSPTPRCSSYWKWNLLVALDYSRQFYLLLWRMFD